MSKKSEMLEEMRKIAQNEHTAAQLHIHMPTGETEIIINPNIAQKADYIERAYNDDLHLKTCHDIYIERWFPTHSIDTHDESRHDFGWCLYMLRNGCRCRRRGWNGKNQYIELAKCISYVGNDGGVVNVNHENIGNKAIAFVGTSGVQMGWLASQADMLADDWEVAE